jgi:predicted Zn-ribbon and HTH transcriptional regulator
VTDPDTPADADTPTGPDADAPADPTDERPSRTDVREAMEPFEPYTTGEVARLLDAPKRVVRSVLNALAGDDELRKKEPSAGGVVWIREPPVHACPECGYEFRIKILHPILSPVRRCPRCGSRLG